MDDHQSDRNAAGFWALALCAYLIMPGAYAQNANSSEDGIEVKRTSMQEKNLTETEKRNLARTEEWRKEGSTPGGDLERLTNEIYAESTEVFLPLNTPPPYML
jgi:hypothetical protein